MNIERNIKLEHGRYRVQVTRRPRALDGGRFDTLEEARQKRDQLEAEYRAHRPWGVAPRKEVRRTHKDLRRERLAAGLCQLCGIEPHRLGKKSCACCIQICTTKRRERNQLKALTI